MTNHIGQPFLKYQYYNSAVQFARSHSSLFVAVFILGTFARLAYGLAREHDEIFVSGPDFIRLWDYDALEHVLIAKGLIEERAYRVSAVEGLVDKHIRIGRDGLFKAPLYEMFLAVVFSISGYSFLLYFPLQALAGGVLSGLTALIGLRAFGNYAAAWFAGVMAAGHPILVNSAVQPYNENLFFALQLTSIWFFFCWHDSPTWPAAALCGLFGGLAILCRESALPPLVTIVLASIFVARSDRNRLTGAVLIAVTAAAVLSPWAVRNYLREGIFAPVAGATGTVLGIGNNECVAADPLLSWYWAEDPCPSLDARRAELRAVIPQEFAGSWLREDRIYASLGRAFILEHPLSYAGLSFRRLVTIVVPFHPKQPQGLLQRVGQTVYWALVFPVGLLGIAISLQRSCRKVWLLVAFIAVSLLPLILIYFPPDLRMRAGADLMLAMFAGVFWTDLFFRWQKRSDASVSFRSPAVGSP